VNGSTVGFVALCLAYAGLAPRLIARIRPQVGVRLVVGASVGVAVAGVFVLGATGFTLAAQDPKVAKVGSWSTDELRAVDPVPHAEAMLSLLLLVAVVLSVVRLGWRRVRALQRVRRTIRDCRPTADVLLVADDRAEAFTTAGPGSVIVVTTGLMDSLSDQEQRALLAHERSHRRHQHVWWLVAMDLAVAANPLLARTSAAVAHAVERWADEDAAEHVADRRLVARTLARVALIRKQGAVATAVLAAAAVRAAGGDVPARVRAMLAPRPRGSALASVAVGLILAGVLVMVTVLQVRADAMFDAAQLPR
jgi:beta-lactamase regulating signal transducer with metallopeptidase domain